MWKAALVVLIVGAAVVGIVLLLIVPALEAMH